MKNAMYVGAALAGFLFLGVGSASAQGLDGLHDQRVEGGKVCFSEHSHAGNGSGATRAAAERDAAGSWEGFTALEYGNLWGSFRLAAGKTMNCSQSGGSWSCYTEARPCRPAGGSGARAVRKKAAQ